MTVAEFRAAFPQFTEELFPDARVSFYLILARKRLSPERWDDLLEEGTGLFTAHYLTLERAASAGADGTGGIDAAAGPVISITKTVGGVSKSETRAGAAATGYISAGQWNDTIYGKQFYELALLVGAGGTVV
jgi:hypothetical protein